MKNLFCIFLCLFILGVANATSKTKNYDYQVLNFAPKPFTLNGKPIKKGDIIKGKTILSLNNTQAIRLRQIRNDGKRVVFTVGPKSIKRNESINGLFKRKLTSSKDKPFDWRTNFNDTLYLIDTLSLQVHVSPDCHFEISNIKENPDTIKVYPHDNELILTKFTFESIKHSQEEKFKVTIRRNDEYFLLSDNFYIIFIED